MTQVNHGLFMGSIDEGITDCCMLWGWDEEQKSSNGGIRDLILMMVIIRRIWIKSWAQMMIQVEPILQSFPLYIRTLLSLSRFPLFFFSHSPLFLFSPLPLTKLSRINNLEAKCRASFCISIFRMRNLVAMHWTRHLHARGYEERTVQFYD